MYQPKEKDWELIESFTLDSNQAWSRNAEPNGTPYNFDKVYVTRYYPTGIPIIGSGYGRIIFADELDVELACESKRHAANDAPYANIAFLERCGDRAYVRYTQTVKANSDVYWYTKFNGYGAFPVSGFFLPLFGNVKKIYMNAQDEEPAGTIVNIYAQRA